MSGSIIFILILVVATFITMYIKKADDQWAYMVKFAWYFIAFVIGLIMYVTKQQPVDNFYEYVVFVIVGIEAVDNFRMWQNSGFKYIKKDKE